MADKTRTYRIASLGFERRPRLTRSTRRSPWATMMIFPGSGQSLRDFSAQFSAAAGEPRARSTVQRKLGLRERHELAPAEAVISGSGRGLSGSAWVCARRTGCGWGTDARLPV